MSATRHQMFWHAAKWQTVLLKLNLFLLFYHQTCKYGHIETTRNADTIDETFIYLCCDKLCADIWVWFYSIVDRLMSKWFLLDAKRNDNYAYLNGPKHSSTSSNCHKQRCLVTKRIFSGSILILLMSKKLFKQKLLLQSILFHIGY